MILAAIDNVQTDPQSLHHGRARTAQVMRCPVTVLAVGKHQGIVVTPSGKGLAVFEPGLAITDLFTHHLYAHMPIILLFRKAPLRISCKGFEFLKEMQGEGGEEDMVVLFLAASAFDIFAGEEPGLPVQIDLFPFGLQQLANPAQRAQTDLEQRAAFLSLEAVCRRIFARWRGCCNRRSFVGSGCAVPTAPPGKGCGFFPLRRRQGIRGAMLTCSVGSPSTSGARQGWRFLAQLNI